MSYIVHHGWLPEKDRDWGIFASTSEYNLRVNEFRNRCNGWSFYRDGICSPHDKTWDELLGCVVTIIQQPFEGVILPNASARKDGGKMSIPDNLA